MTDRKDRQNEQDDKTEKFTGSPEQKFPDLEAEDQQGRQEERTVQRSRRRRKGPRRMITAAIL